MDPSHVSGTGTDNSSFIFVKNEEKSEKAQNKNESNPHLVFEGRTSSRVEDERTDNNNHNHRFNNNYNKNYKGPYNNRNKRPNGTYQKRHFNNNRGNARFTPHGQNGQNRSNSSKFNPNFNKNQNSHKNNRNWSNNNNNSNFEYKRDTSRFTHSRGSEPKQDFNEGFASHSETTSLTSPNWKKFDTKFLRAKQYNDFAIHWNLGRTVSNDQQDEDSSIQPHPSSPVAITFLESQISQKRDNDNTNNLALESSNIFSQEIINLQEVPKNNNNISLADQKCQKKKEEGTSIEALFFESLCPIGFFENCEKFFRDCSNATMFIVRFLIENTKYQIPGDFFQDADEAKEDAYFRALSKVESLSLEIKEKKKKDMEFDDASLLYYKR